jgi:hypothetical protein
LCPFVVKRRGMLPVTLSVPSENLSFLEVWVQSLTSLPPTTAVPLMKQWHWQFMVAFSRFPLLTSSIKENEHSYLLLLLWVQKHRVLTEPHISPSQLL